MVIGVASESKLLRRHFVFLQGMPSPFFRRIGEALEKCGCRVTRINFCVGDWFFWHGRNTLGYRGRAADWGRFVADFFERNDVTDLVLLGEQRRYHKEAVELAQARGIRVSVTDFGYLRPDWITLERDGMGGNSRFPRDAQEIRRRAADVGRADLARRYADSAFNMVVGDLLYNFANFFLGICYPHYRRTDCRPHTLIYTTASALHLLRCRLRRRKSQTRVAEIAASNTRYFVLPLQLDHDFQIVVYSPFAGMAEVIRQVVESFARCASAETHLIIKVHPWDAGLINWRRQVGLAAEEFRVADRVEYLDGGSLDKLVQSAAGMVTVNSTAGLYALQQGCPVKILGQAVYDVPELTFQGGLDEFWTDPTPPVRDLLDAFVDLMAATIQIRGVFFSEPGSTAAVESAVQWLIAGEH